LLQLTRPPTVCRGQGDPRWEAGLLWLRQGADGVLLTRPRHVPAV